MSGFRYRIKSGMAFLRRNDETGSDVAPAEAGVQWERSAPGQ